MNRVYGVCSLSIFRLEFPAGGASLYPLAKLPAESGGRRRGDRLGGMHRPARSPSRVAWRAAGGVVLRAGGIGLAGARLARAKS